MRLVVDIPANLITQILLHLGDGATDDDVSRFIADSLERSLGNSEGRSPTNATRKPAPQSAGRLPVVAAPDLSGSDLVADPFPTERVSGIDDAEGRDWVWGQVNRVLPIKFISRALSRVADEDPSALEDPHAVMAPLARDYALKLREVAESLGTRRDDRLDVGFPSGDDAEAALDRFLSQFFFTMREDGSVSGAMPLLGLIGPYGSTGVGLTDTGLEFARLPNPLLDSGDPAAGRLSVEEQGFYATEVLKRCPGEAAAFRSLLSALADGFQRNAEIEERLRQGVGSEWSDTLLSTQRSGAMGRMLDLDLVKRKRMGVKVRFQLTSRGTDLLERLRGDG